jgi:hypothetical protein
VDFKVKHAMKTQNPIKIHDHTLPSHTVSRRGKSDMTLQQQHCRKAEHFSSSRNE